MREEPILVIKNKRTLGYDVKYVRNGFHRTISCGTPAEAAANAIDIKRRLFSNSTRIIAPPEILGYL